MCCAWICQITLIKYTSLIILDFFCKENWPIRLNLDAFYTTNHFLYGLHTRPLIVCSYKQIQSSKTHLTQVFVYSSQVNLLSQLTTAISHISCFPIIRQPQIWHCADTSLISKDAISQVFALHTESPFFSWVFSSKKNIFAVFWVVKSESRSVMWKLPALSYQMCIYFSPVKGQC